MITNYTIGIHLRKDSQNFKFFSQVWPVTHIPSIFMIKQSTVVYMVDSSKEVSVTIENLSKLIRMSGQREDDKGEQSSTSKNKENINKEKDNNSREHSTESQVSEKTDSGQPSFRGENDHNSTSVNQPNRPQESKPASKEAASKEPSFKDGPSQPSSQSDRYQQRLWKHRQEDAEERKRILRLVQTDRKEQRANQEYHQRRYSQNSPKPRAMSRSQAESRMVIRLFDGSAIKHIFDSSQTLDSVRQWIDENRTDSDAPYTLMQTFPRKKFSPSEETRTLRELDLVPSTTLILKPVTHISNAYAPIGWFKRAIRWVIDAIYIIMAFLFKFPQHYQHSNNHNNNSALESSSLESSPSVQQNSPKQLDDNSRITYNGNQLSLKDDSDTANHIS